MLQLLLGLEQQIADGNDVFRLALERDLQLAGDDIDGAPEFVDHVMSLRSHAASNSAMAFGLSALPWNSGIISGAIAPSSLPRS